MATPHGVKAKQTSLKKAKAQRNLLNAVDHGWHPTGKPASESVKRIKALIAEGRHKDGCTCGFCQNMNLLKSHKKSKAEKPDKKLDKEPEEPKEPPMQEGQDDIGKLPMSKEAKSYARRGGLASMKKQPQQYISMVAKETNQAGKQKGFRNFDAEEVSTGGALGSKSIVTKKNGKKQESMAKAVVATLLDG